MDIKIVGLVLMVLGAVCVFAGLCSQLYEWRLQKSKDFTTQQTYKAGKLLRRKLSLGLASILCLLFGGVFTYVGSQPTKDELVTTALHQNFPNEKTTVYAVGYTTDDWAQINFRGTVSMIATRGNSEVQVGCMIKPGQFTPMASPKLYALFTELERCPTNVEFAAAQ